MTKLMMKPTLTLELARLISSATEAEADRIGGAVAIAITDEKGDLIHFIRKDHTTNAAIQIAKKKAFHAAFYGRSTGYHEEILAKGSQNIGVLSLPECMPIEGGIPFFYEGIVVGAIGVSGLASDVDGQIAQKGYEEFKRCVGCES